ncbi:MAG: serine/threonine-protein phosphatase [Bacteroidetes Order II. Incertae sedis bacterium]|nr:serine/threonine-protein phosphatase [Bacteroidetes Order II. bacterium]
MQYHTALISHAGGRRVNQDFAQHATAPPNGSCWVVADGLGGHGGGEVAAETAVTKILEAFVQKPYPSTETITGCILAAQHAVLEKQDAYDSLKRMRTTLVMMVGDAQKVQWAHIGDSRLYCFRDRGLLEYTLDHSVPQALVDAGSILPSDIRSHEDRNRILRSLGNMNDLRPTIRPERFEVRTGDAFLLCTDGFWEYVHEIEMQADLAKSNQPEQWLKLMEERILSRVKGENDNYTAMAVMVA